MPQSLHSRQDRARGGSAITKFIVWTVLISGLYTAYAYSPAIFAKGKLERIAEKGLARVSHDAEALGVRRSIAKYASAASVELDEESIRVERETRPGERIFHVAFEYPVTVTFLGSERTVTRDIRVTYSVGVNEANLARAEDAERRRLEAHADFRRETKAAFAECEDKHGKGNCSYSEYGSPGGGRHEVVKNY